MWTAETNVYFENTMVNDVINGVIGVRNIVQQIPELRTNKYLQFLEELQIGL